MGYVQRFWHASLRQSWPLYLVVIVIFSLGVLLGSLGVNTLREDQTAELQRYMQSFLAGAAELNVDGTRVFKEALYDNALTAVIMYILGLTVICLPVMLAFIFLRGFILGFTVGFLTMDRELQGLLVILVSMLPQNLFFIPAMIIGGTASLSFSLLLIRRFFNSQTRVWPAFVAYTLVMTGVLAVFTLAGLVEGYVTPQLTRFVASFTAGW